MRHRRLSALILAVTVIVVSQNEHTAAVRRPSPPHRPHVPPTVLTVPEAHAAARRSRRIRTTRCSGAGGLMQRVHETGGTVRVVYLTDGEGYPEGVEAEEHDGKKPTAGRLSAATAAGAGTKRAHALVGARRSATTSRRFSGFPDGGLCKLMRIYWSDAARRVPLAVHAPRSPAASRSARAGDANSAARISPQELAQIIGDFRPTMIAVPRKEDQHADHCAAWFFLADALTDVRRVAPRLSDRRAQLHRALLLVAVRGRRAARSIRRRACAAARPGWMHAAADAGGGAREAPGAAALPDADARHGLVPRRVRAQSTRCSRGRRRSSVDPAEPAQSLLRCQYRAMS